MYSGEDEMKGKYGLSCHDGNVSVSRLDSGNLFRTSSTRVLIYAHGNPLEEMEDERVYDLAVNLARKGYEVAIINDPKVDYADEADVVLDTLQPVNGFNADLKERHGSKTIQGLDKIMLNLDSRLKDRAEAA